jgi:hypothetical protein
MDTGAVAVGPSLLTNQYFLFEKTKAWSVVTRAQNANSSIQQHTFLLVQISNPKQMPNNETRPGHTWRGFPDLYE